MMSSPIKKKSRRTKTRTIDHSRAEGLAWGGNILFVLVETAMIHTNQNRE